MAENDLWARQTAPQSPYTNRQVGIGILVAIVLIAFTFGLPFALV